MSRHLNWFRNSNFKIKPLKTYKRNLEKVEGSGRYMRRLFMETRKPLVLAKSSRFDDEISCYA